MSDTLPVLTSANGSLPSRFAVVTPSQFRDDEPVGTFRDGPECNAEAVPAVDRHDGERQFRQLVLGELLPGLIVNFVGNMVFGNQGHRLGPRQGRPFPVGIKSASRQASSR